MLSNPNPNGDEDDVKYNVWKRTNLYEAMGVNANKELK